MSAFHFDINSVFKFSNGLIDQQNNAPLEVIK